MLCWNRMVFTSCDRCISILAVSLIICSLNDARQPWSKWPQMIKKTIARAQCEVAERESDAKWKKPWGRGRVVLGQEPILAPIVFFFVFCFCLFVFFSLFAPSILTNKLILFFQKMRSSIFDIQESFFKISRIPIIFYPNIPYPDNP